MLNSTTLEVAIGLVFCYASVALVSSALYEAIASMFKLRARSLLDGVKALINDPNFTGLAKDLYNHALINPRAGGDAIAEKDLDAKPSYIDPQHFAQALIDCIQGVPGDFAALKVKIDALKNDQLRKLLQGMYLRADGKVQAMEAAVAGWFDRGMARVSGVYKRKAQLFSFIAALLIAGLLNVDSFQLFKTLWNHPAYVAQIGARPSDAADALKQLMMLPVGWTQAPWAMPAEVLVLAFLGWLVTALSALFGAPFWFDLLQRLVNLRGTGAKPEAKPEAKPTA